MIIPTADRFAGSLIGQCLGDALGFVVEGGTPEMCAAYATEVVRAGKVPPRSEEFPFGQYSDDSQLARELMISFVNHRAFDPGDFARRIAALFAENRIVGHGRTTLAAAQRLMAGVPWDKAAEPGPAAGNGSAMRAGPVGLLCGHRPQSLVLMAHDQGRITHGEPRCSAGAVAVAGAVAQAATAESIDTGRFLETLVQWTNRIEPTFAAGLRQLRDLLDAPPDEAAERISRIGLPPGVDSHWRGGISAFVVSSVLWALYAFLRSPNDYVETIATAVQPGGDVDTTAAMAGAMSGAFLGLEALPQDLCRLVNDRGEWGYEDLVTLALDCREAALACAPV